MALGPMTKRALRELRTHLNPQGGVVVRSIKKRFRDNDGDNCLGVTYPIIDEEDRILKFEIIIDGNLPDYWQREILIHEWSHTMVWAPEDSELGKEPHNDTWGSCYSRCYRTIIEGSKGK